MSAAVVETFRTDLVPSARRLSYWNDVAVTTFGDIVIDARAPRFDACMRRRRLGELAIVDVTSAPARVCGGSAKTRGLFVILNECGMLRVSQHGRESVLAAGELAPLHADSPYLLEFSQRNRCLVLHISECVPNVDLAAHIARRHAQADGALIREFMRRLVTLQNEPPVSYARVAQDLAALTWPSCAQPVTRNRPMAHWRERAFAVVARRFDDPDLDAASIATELGVSTRFVHMIFASAGETPTDFILEQRLVHAAAALRAHRAATITEIALAAGFTDLSRFCRTFRRRFGMSARRYRAY